MTRSGKTFVILGILWKVFIVVILMHLICITIQFIIAGSISHKNPFQLIKNQSPGTPQLLARSPLLQPFLSICSVQRPMAFVPNISNFVVPLCANIHMAGSMITITACATAVCLMNQIDISLATVIPFIATLGVAMICIAWCARWFYHDCSSISLYDFWYRTWRPGRSYLCNYGCTVYHTGILLVRLVMFPAIMQSV